MKTTPPLRIRPRALVIGLVSASIVCGGAVAYAQSTSAAATTDTLVGSALNTLGNAVSTLRSEVSILQQSERVARATLTETGAITAQTGSWISRVDHPAPGTYFVAFTPSVFSTPPTCVTSANANDVVAPSVECHAVTTGSMTCRATTASGPVNSGLFLICAGY